MDEQPVPPVEDQPAAQPEGEATESGPEPARAPQQRLMRSRHARIIAGVSGGLGEYSGIDPVLIRVALILLAIFGNGIGLLIYLIAWIIIPLEPQHALAAEQEVPAQRGRSGTGALLLGLLLIIIGAIWFIESADIAEVDAQVALACALIAVGGLLVLTLGRFARGPLIGIGIVIAIVLGGTANVDIVPDGSFGDRTERPSTVAELEDSYAQSFGSMTLDFTKLTLPAGTTHVDATTTFGSLEILVPSAVGVRVDASTSFGSVQAFGAEISGVDADRVIQSSNYATAERRLDIKLSSRFGSAEVITR